MSIKLHFESSDASVSQRPIFRALVNHIGVTCLLDTGAIIPVFSQDGELFNILFSKKKGITPIRYVTLKGFGDTYASGLVYNVPKFALSDGNNSIIYNNMKVLHLPGSMPCDLVLPSTMFIGTRYGVNSMKSPCDIYVEAEKEEMTTRISIDSNSIYVFSQDS